MSGPAPSRAPRSSGPWSPGGSLRPGLLVQGHRRLPPAEPARDIGSEGNPGHSPNSDATIKALEPRPRSPAATDPPLPEVQRRFLLERPGLRSAWTAGAFSSSSSARRSGEVPSSRPTQRTPALDDLASTVCGHVPSRSPPHGRRSSRRAGSRPTSASSGPVWLPRRSPSVLSVIPRACEPWPSLTAPCRSPRLPPRRPTSPEQPWTRGAPPSPSRSGASRWSTSRSPQGSPRRRAAPALRGPRPGR
jgi:hypothetical protein